MITKPISYGRQYITDEDIAAVIETLKSDYLTQGPKIKEFEEKFAAYCGAKYDVLVSNGTAGLHLAALALDIKPGDKIVTTPITFVASANGFRYCGAEVVFCDINKDNFLLDLDCLENILKASPRVLIRRSFLLISLAILSMWSDFVRLRMNMALPLWRMPVMRLAVPSLTARV